MIWRYLGIMAVPAVLIVIGTCGYLIIEGDRTNFLDALYMTIITLTTVGYVAWEAAGLRWLSGVVGGVPCAEVVSFGADHLTLRRLDSVPPSPDAAYEFGGRLAVTHDAGAAAFGAGPDGWDGPGFFGPLSQPLPMPAAGRLMLGINDNELADNGGAYTVVVSKQ